VLFLCSWAVVSINELGLVGSDSNLAMRVVSRIPHLRNAPVPALPLQALRG
jgi:hypothetical protein